MKDEHYNRIKKKKKWWREYCILSIKGPFMVHVFFCFLWHCLSFVFNKNNLKTYNMKEGTSLGIVFTFK